VPPRAPAFNPNDLLCYKCGLPGHLARNCYQNQNQLALPSNASGNNQSHNNNDRPYGRGQAFHVDATQAQEQPKVVTGIHLVNSAAAFVLFDPKASHSFMSEKFANTHNVKCEPMNTPIVVCTPAGQKQTSLFSPDVTVDIEGMEFRAFPVILNSSNIDLILGTDWLRANSAKIYPYLSRFPCTATLSLLQGNSAPRSGS
jgi:hypothetical protein